MDPKSDIGVTHTYPAAIGLARRVGGDAVLVLHVLLSEATATEDGFVSTVSTRDIAERLARLSKDTVHRRLRDLRRAGVIELLPPTLSAKTAPTYRLHLAATGLSRFVLAPSTIPGPF